MRVVCLTLLHVAAGFVNHQHARAVPSCRRAATSQVETIKLESNNVASTAAFVETSVREWLDDEWIEQECHERIASRAALSYATAIENGVSELGDLVVRLGTDLGGAGPTTAVVGTLTEDFAEAFVGPWDVANYVSDLLVQRTTGEACACSAAAPSAPESPEASALAARARTLREEARQLEVELAAEAPPAPVPAPTAPAPRNDAIPDSAWKFVCSLDALGDTATRRRFTLLARLRRGDRAGDGDAIGDVELVESPDRFFRRGLAWKVERDELSRDALFLRVSLDVADGFLPETDGRTLYLNARVRKEEDGAVTLDDGTLTVKRQQMTRFLFVEYPSLLAQFKVVGTFSAAPAEK